MLIKINEEIILRQLMESDTRDIFQIINSQREYLGRWLPFVQFTKELNDSIEYVDSVIHAPAEIFEYVFSIRKYEILIGLIGFKNSDRLNKRTEIGYWISQENQKKGIVTKSVEKLCDFAFQELGMNRIQIKCAVGNTASSKIPKKLNFYFEGIERQGEWFQGNIFFDLEVYSKLKED